MPKPIGYFVEFGTVKGGKTAVPLQFCGGIAVPVNFDTNHYYTHLKENTFEKGCLISSVMSTTELGKKVGSFIELRIEGRNSDTWTQLDENVQEHLDPPTWWTHKEYGEWCKRKHEASEEKTPDIKPSDDLNLGHHEYIEYDDTKMPPDVKVYLV